MTDRPPPDDPDDSDGDTGWDEPPADRPRLYPVREPTTGQTPGSPRPPDDPDAAGGEVPWGNTTDELLIAVLEQVNRLAGTVGELDVLGHADRDDDDDAGPGKHRPYRYERRTPAEAARAHAELTRWVAWLVTTYQLTDVVPPCWDRHDALAEELAGFYVAWQNVWADRGRDDAAVGWHDQLHRAVAGRWATWFRGARCADDCALDTDFLDSTMETWTDQSSRARGAEYRLERTRRCAPPIPPRTRKTTPAPLPPHRRHPPQGGPDR